MKPSACLAWMIFGALQLAALADGFAQAAPAADTAFADDEGGERGDVVDRLLIQMTLEEKIGQLTLFTADQQITGPGGKTPFREGIRSGRVGAVFNAYGAETTRELQSIAVNESRLKIPLLVGLDVIHGYRTIFPISLGEAASWDLEAIERSARVSAIEASAEGVNWTFAPMVDIARDPRWGRISEGAGEDPYLGSRIAEARVRGFQGADLSAPDTILATAKHFVAYGAAQAGRDYHTTDMSERALREVYLPPFKAAVDAGVATMMSAFNDLNGAPATGNKFLLTDVLRDEWAFAGFVVSDFTSVNEMIAHGFAEDEAQAGDIAINAGLDMDMQGGAFMGNLAKSVAAGRVSFERVDEAVRAILEMKWRLGLFDDPYRYSDPAREKAEADKPEHLESARDVARKSMVLLKNERGVLPIKSGVKSIALIGPLGDSKADMIGSWAGIGDRTSRPVTILEGLRARAGAPAIRYVKGAGYDLADGDDASGFAEAIEAAREADIVIAAMGERWDMTGEAASRTSLDLPGAQEALLRELKKTGKPIILVLMNGRPLSIAWAAENADAILEAWYPGTMGGHAVADVLFGDHNPSGKLPVTFPRSVGQVPIFYSAKNTGRPHAGVNEDEKYVSRYLDAPNTPLFPFGHGLSYTKFEYSPVRLSRSKIGPGETLTANVTIKNAGEREGAEIVQLYLRDFVGSVTRPVKELKGFQKISLKPGECKTVSFTIGEGDLAFYRADMSYGAEPGEFMLFVGGSSDNTVNARFALTE